MRSSTRPGIIPTWGAGRKLLVHAVIATVGQLACAFFTVERVDGAWQLFLNEWLESGLNVGRKWDEYGGGGKRRNVGYNVSRVIGRACLPWSEAQWKVSPRQKDGLR